MTTALDARPPDDTNVMVGYNVHDLLFKQRGRQNALALHLGLTPSVLSKKMRGESAWSAHQVAVAAEFLGVEPGRLYRQVTVATLRAKLMTYTGEPVEAPRRGHLRIVLPSQ